MDNVRSMMAAATGQPYVAFNTLAEAAANDGVVILEGDDSGQIYLSCPAIIARCGEEGLRRVLVYLDERSWNDPDSAYIYYEKHAPGSAVAGGMGGGLVTDDVWLHPKLAEQNLLSAVRSFIRGETEGLG